MARVHSHYILPAVAEDDKADRRQGEVRRGTSPRVVRDSPAARSAFPVLRSPNRRRRRVAQGSKTERIYQAGVGLDLPEEMAAALSAKQGGVRLPPSLRHRLRTTRDSLAAPPNPAADERLTLEPFPDLGSLSDDGLKQLIDGLTKEELEVSYRRRILQGTLDLLRAELQARLQTTGGRSGLQDEDVGD
jgi:hypothetical protein